jgi:ABC-type transporter Mla subunit MlaD
MTPEEFGRKEQFIMDSLARLTAAQEQDRHDRIGFQNWSAEMFGRMDRTDQRLAQLFDRQTELLAHQSARIDRMDGVIGRIDNTMNRIENGINRIENGINRIDAAQSQILHLLNLILDRLPPLRGNET